VVEHSLTQTAPTGAEMDRMRRASETDDERALADPQSFGVALSDYIAQGDWRLFFLFRDATERVQAADVAASAQRYFRREQSHSRCLCSGRQARACRDSGAPVDPGHVEGLHAARDHRGR